MKRKLEIAKHTSYLTDNNLYELDLYELDQLYNTMGDFNNNLEMGHHQLGMLADEIKTVKANLTWIDLCDSICDRRNETILTKYRATKLE